MSMIRQLIGAIANAERQIDDQSRRLTSFNSQLDQLIRQVQSTYEGSQQNVSSEMLGQLQTTKKQVEDAIQSLAAAKQKLQQVKMV